MSFRIQHNVTALTAHRHLGINDTAMNKSLERLSSGYRINSAADDAAGMAASMRFRAEIRSLQMASQNCQQGTSMLQVAEGAFVQIEHMLHRMKELATQAASGNAGIDRDKIDAEVKLLELEISRIVGSTEYNGEVLLDGSFGATQLSSNPGTDLVAGTNGITNVEVDAAFGDNMFWVQAISPSANTITLTDGKDTQTKSYDNYTNLDPGQTTVVDFGLLGIAITIDDSFNEGAFTANNVATPASVTTASTINTGQVGAAQFQIADVNNAYGRMGVNMPDMRLEVLANGSHFDIDLTTLENAQEALDTIDKAIDKAALERGNIGAYLNRFSYANANLAVQIENKIASESVIRDVDMAAEMSNFTKNNILVQSGVGMLAQANQIQQSVLQILQ